jgi:mannose-6-phosphate isomerase-like protein (cupin superfamily)
MEKRTLSGGDTVPTEPTEQVGTRLMFENDRVRVWDLSLAPGESLEKHIHRLDYVYIVESGGLIRFADPDNPSDYRDVQFRDGEVVFVPVGPGGKVDNRLTNIGTKHHRNYVIELTPAAQERGI